MARRRGIKIVAGTDWGYGSDAPEGVHREISNLVELGLTPLEALRAATIIAAEMIRRDDSIGIIEKGYQADLIAVRENPLSDVKTLGDPLLVITNGSIVLNKF
jgi:imidazolonepropionase-like amidohydrolase